MSKLDIARAQERELDPERSESHAEAAQQDARHTAAAVDAELIGDAAAHHVHVAPTATVAESTVGYYDLPVVKPAPWKWFVPAYFYAGGVAGAASVLRGAALLAGDKKLAKQLGRLAFAGEAIGAALLVADLGKPQRFHHMMRVVRPTSPMNVGTWILGASSLLGALELVRPSKRLDVSTIAAMVAGGGLATYTGVLIGNTAIPVWRHARTALPALFAASAGASAASLLELAGVKSPLVRRFALATKTAELAAARAVETQLGVGVVGAPLREGRSGMLWRGARVLQGASVIATAVRATRVAGALGTVAAVMTRFAIHEAGRASAADPRATLSDRQPIV
ncbi:MAG TPA: NrfD/PsrC family molybdoenzyme membrane anchor subunit [Kofleriaceae bacterium]|jgi:formate-dependent nitrite reductase membrane component NrfD